MKKVLFAVSTIGLMAATPAFAQPSEILLSATVTGQCGTGNHLSGSDTNPGWDQSDIVVDLGNGGNGRFAGQTFTNRSVGNVWCNSPASVTLTVEALTTSNSTTDTNSFANQFDIRFNTDMGVYLGQGTGYVLATNVGGGNTTASTNFAFPQAFETGTGRYSGLNSIEVLPSLRGSDVRRPVAGTYSGAIRLTATPAP